MVENTIKQEYVIPNQIPIDIVSLFSLKATNEQSLKRQFSLILFALKKISNTLNVNSIFELLSLDIQILEPINNLQENSKKYLDYLIFHNHYYDNYNLTLDKCRIEVQENLQNKKRKEFAAYYTNKEALKISQEIIKKYVYERFNKNNAKEDKKKYIISDPFMGTAKTLVSAIEIIKPEKIKYVFGIEPYYPSALIGFASLIELFNGKTEKLYIFFGDAFEIIPKFFGKGPVYTHEREKKKKRKNIIEENQKYNQKTNQKENKMLKNEIIKKLPFNLVDIIITNPPFTRWSNLTIKQRETLNNFITKHNYKKFFTRLEAGLQIYSLLLCDLIQKPQKKKLKNSYFDFQNPLLISVLPLSSFYTIGGSALKKLLVEKYNTLALLGSNENSSFSDDSGFKEIILIAQKKDISDNSLIETLFSSNIEEIEFISYEIFGKSSINSYKNIHHQVSNNTLRMKGKIIHNCLKKGTEKSTEKYSKNKPVKKLGNYYRLDTLPSFLNNNWLVLFETVSLQKTIIKIIDHGLKNETLSSWNNIFGNKNLIRGFEMYGPDFFFIPNKYWELLSDYKFDCGDKWGDRILIKNRRKNIEILIPKKYLIKALWKPSTYFQSIRISVDTFVLAIPPKPFKKLDKGLQEYIKWGIDSKIPIPAIKSFGENWYSHIYNTILNKKPLSRLFIPDKIDLHFKNRSSIINYSNDLIIASKNFYLYRNPIFAKKINYKNIDFDELNYLINKANENEQDFIKENVDLDRNNRNDYNRKVIWAAAWFNSSFFLAYILLFSRKISNTWTRLLRDDYLQAPFPNFSKVREDLLLELELVFNDLISIESIPNIWDQLKNFRPKVRLDLIFCDILKIKEKEDFLRIFYKELLEYKERNLKIR